jgi:hypothetical protein
MFASFGPLSFAEHMFASFGSLSFAEHMFTSFGSLSFAEHMFASFGSLSFAEHMFASFGSLCGTNSDSEHATVVTSTSVGRPSDKCDVLRRWAHIVQEFLDIQFPGCSVRCDGPISWPPFSPDSTPCGGGLEYLHRSPC